MMAERSVAFRAALWMTGTITAFSVMAVGGRELADELDTFEIMMFRSFIGLAIVLTIGSYFGILHQVQRARLGLHILRNIAHFTGQNLWFLALSLIPLAQVFALEFTVPLWVALAAPLFLNEKLTPIRTISIAIGFVGILFVTRPGMIEITPGVIAAALAAIGFAATAIMTKLLTRHEPLISILFWLTILQAIFGIVTAGYDADIALPSRAALPWVVLVGVAGLVAHFCLTNALKIAPAAVVTPLDFARLPVIIAIGALVYSEPLDLYVILGALIIFAGITLMVRAETRGTVTKT